MREDELRETGPSAWTWDRVEALHAEGRARTIRQWQERDGDARQVFLLEQEGLLADLTRHRWDRETRDALIGLAESSGLAQAIADQFSGLPVNRTEQRPVLHTALRRLPEDGPLLVGGRDVMPDILGELDRMEVLATRLREGLWLGAGGRPLRHLVNIGIGGSDLGPRMAVNALRGPGSFLVSFVSNVDGADLARVLETCDPEETLFCVASKTFTTQETMANARAARSWLLEHLGGGEATVRRHFMAVSTQSDRVAAFGIDPQHRLTFWDFVGGRFSLCSAIGFPLMVAIGPEGFRSFLQGCRAMDRHVQTADWQRNLPVLMGLLAVWYANLFRWPHQAVIPYAQPLSLWVSYLQQGEMESNGKGVDREGKPVGYPTAPVLWGEVGTNAQHAFFQLLHQGTHTMPLDFIGFAQPSGGSAGQHRVLMAHMLAQSEALAHGADPGLWASRNEPELLPFRSFPGGLPSTVLLLERLSPWHLGLLVSLYEHKIMVTGHLWNIHSYDQWGVELGKILAGQILERLEGQEGPGRDPGVEWLIERLRR